MLMARRQRRGEHTLKRSLGPLNLITLGIGAIIGAGHLRADRAGGRAVRRAGAGALVCRGGHRLRVCRALLCGVCGDDSAGRVGLYLWLCDAGRDLLAWIIGWDLVLEYAFGAATGGVGLERLS